MTEGDRVSPDAVCRAPFFRNGLGETCDTGLGESVVGLSGVSVYARGAGDVDDGAGLAVLDAEVGCGGTDELEGGGAVEREDCVPLLVGRL